MSRALVLAAVIVVAMWGFPAARVASVRDDRASVPRCAPSAIVMTRVERGRLLGRSEDVLFVPRGFNYLGSFNVVSHSGPREYLQGVPLTLYGPSITASGAVDRDVTLADVYPTVVALTGANLDVRAGRALHEALDPGGGRLPRLVVVVVWDGAGSNVLRRWPDAFPNLSRLSSQGTSYERATVGSSPSITPATHATLGTGAFPNEHGVTGIQYRRDTETIGVSFEERDPAPLELSTFADDLDAYFDNEPRVGMLGWRSWQIGMLGHGASIPGGDRDDLGIIDHRGRVTGKRPYFRVPSYLRGSEETLQSHLDAADSSDGELDGDWRGHPVETDHDNPGWVSYQTELLRRMIQRGGYGADDVVDVLLTNFKATDRVGHLYNMESAEMEEILSAQDAALGDLVALLDETVGDYALVLTADHGHTPSPETTGAWPIDQRELEDDIDDHFSVPPGETLVQAMTAVGVFVDEVLMLEMSVTEEEIAAFLLRYTIVENWQGDTLPEGYEERGSETVVQAAFPSSRIPEPLQCVGSSR